LKDCLLVSWRLVDAGEGYKFDCSWRSLVVTIYFFCLVKLKNNALDSSRIGRGTPTR